MSVYFAEAVGLDAVKVGVCRTNVGDRISDLQVGCPVLIRLIKLVPGGCALERALHRKWKEHRIRGEWFKLSAIEGDFAGLSDNPLDHVLRCETCGQPLRSRRSRRGVTGMCRTCASKRSQQVPYTETACKRCGSVFVVSPRERKTQIRSYCGFECARAAVSEKMSGNRNAVRRWGRPSSHA